MTNIEKKKLLNECNSLKQNIDRMCECQSRVELYTIFKFVMQDLIEIERMNEIRINNNDMYCNKDCPHSNKGGDIVMI